MGRRHLFLSKLEPHEYIIYSKKTNKKLRAGWVERGQKRKREMNSPIRSSWKKKKKKKKKAAVGTAQRQTLWPVITLSEKKDNSGICIL